MPNTVESVESKVQRIVAGIGNLPTPPVVFHQIQKVLNDSDTGAIQVAAVLSEDPAMSMKVLKLTNSAFYGLSRQIESVRQAVMVVGTEAVRNLVLSASVLDMFRGKGGNQESQETFWRHSLATATACRVLARQGMRKRIVDPDTAFGCGLLHDIGKIVIACFLDADAARLDDQRQKDHSAQDFEVEDRVLGYNHAQLGGFLAGQWKLPQKIVEAITFHHYPHFNRSDSAIPFVVHTANFLAKRTYYDRNEQHRVGSLVPGIEEYFDVTEDQLDRYAAQLRDEYARSETFMQLAGVS